MASHRGTLGVTKGVNKGVKLKLIVSLHLVLKGNIWFGLIGQTLTKLENDGELLALRMKRLEREV